MLGGLIIQIKIISFCNIAYFLTENLSFSDKKKLFVEIYKQTHLYNMLNVSWLEHFIVFSGSP